MLVNLAASLTTMQKSIDDLLTKSDNNAASIKELTDITDLNTKIDDFLTKETGLINDVALVRNEIHEVKGEVKILIDEKEKREQEKRNLNIIIRGVPETKEDEKMHETCGSRRKNGSAEFV